MSKTKYPKRYEMDGIYYRVKRNGVWENVCFTDMTEEEVSHCLGDISATYWRRIAEILARRLRELGEFLEKEGYVWVDPDDMEAELEKELKDV